MTGCDFLWAACGCVPSCVSRARSGVDAVMIAQCAVVAAMRDVVRACGACVFVCCVRVYGLWCVMVACRRALCCVTSGVTFAWCCAGWGLSHRVCVPARVRGGMVGQWSGVRSCGAVCLPVDVCVVRLFDFRERQCADGERVLLC